MSSTHNCSITDYVELSISNSPRGTETARTAPMPSNRSRCSPILSGLRARVRVIFGLSLELEKGCPKPFPVGAAPLPYKFAYTTRRLPAP